jgi:copper transport protein
MQPGRWLLALAAAWAGGAAAHAGLVASIPADGAVLAAPPSSVELRFTEPVTPIEVRLFAGSAAPRVLPAPKGASDVVKLALPANLRGGLYTVSFRVISADSHPVGGSIVFGIGERPPPHVAAASDSGLSRATTMLRAVRDLALLIAAGGALFALGIASFPAERSFLAAAGALAVTASAAGIGLQGADIAGASVWSLDAWRAGLFSSVGVSAAVAAAGAVLIAFAAMFSTGSL